MRLPFLNLRGAFLLAEFATTQAVAACARTRRLGIAAVGAVMALAGCASLDPYAAEPIARHLERDDRVGYCARLFADLDRRVDALDVRDAEAPRVDGFPYLRVDRFSAALAPRTASAAERSAWVTRLSELDDVGRAAELANAALPADDLARCRVLLTAEDASRFDELRDRARVPDSYSTPLRALGLYPVTRLVFAAGVAQWHRDVYSTFATPPSQLPLHGALRTFAPAGTEVEVALPVPADPLGIPRLSRFDRAALLQRHAPVLQIDVAGPYDRPGTVVLDGEDRPAVDVGEPLAYTRVAHALLDGRPHLQLVYTFVFTQRPAEHPLDPLAGRLDGLIWRVTLDHDGTPLVYDSIHACGCYHLFFPTQHVAARAGDDSLDEGLFAPQTVLAPGRNQAIVLRIASASHYVQRVELAPRGAADTLYRLDDERRLTSLPRAGGGSGSAYGSDGMMAGTERGERFFFWPSGIASAGQLRQWGHHATAFVGRRHFDDPDLINRYFALRRGPAGNSVQ